MKEIFWFLWNLPYKNFKIFTNLLIKKLKKLNIKSLNSRFKGLTPMLQKRNLMLTQLHDKNENIKYKNIAIEKLPKWVSLNKLH